MFLYQTASPTVYISSIVIDKQLSSSQGYEIDDAYIDSDDNDDDNDELDTYYDEDDDIDYHDNDTEIKTETEAGYYKNGQDDNEEKQEYENEYEEIYDDYDDKMTMRSSSSSSSSSSSLSSPPTRIDPKTLFTETTKLPSSFRKSKFEYVSPKLFNYQLPTAGEGTAKVPEIAFLGRSNVGKSSLLNALSITSKKESNATSIGIANNGGDTSSSSSSSSISSSSSSNASIGLAKVSKTPGRTQQVNYFGQFLISDDAHNKNKNRSGKSGERDVISNPPLGYIIDLPGYGYAKAPGALVNEWQKNTQDFIVARKEYGSLQRIYLLIDSRRGISPFDSSIMTWLDEATVDYTVVLTKCDAVSRPMMVKCANDICMRHHAQAFENDTNDDDDDDEAVGGGGFQGPFVHITSSRKNIGIVELMYAIEGDFYVGRREGGSKGLKWGS